MSRLIEYLDHTIADAEKRERSFDSTQIWDDVAHMVLAAYPKLRAVVEAADIVVKDPESGYKIKALSDALWDLEEDV